MLYKMDARLIKQTDILVVTVNIITRLQNLSVTVMYLTMVLNMKRRASMHGLFIVYTVS